jgi:hypothetical protein
MSVNRKVTVPEGSSSRRTTQAYAGDRGKWKSASPPRPTWRARLVVAGIDTPWEGLTGNPGFPPETSDGAEGAEQSGGGGNRTRVRGRTGQSVYKLRLPLSFARRPVGSRPTAGLAILWCRASGDWLSLGAEPVSDAATRATGRARSDALRYGLGSESECVIVIRTYVTSRLF